MAETMSCGCDPMVIEDAESCARCDECGPVGCARFQAFVEHINHPKRPGFFRRLFSVQVAKE